MTESWLLGGVRGSSPAGSGSGSDVAQDRFSLLDLDPGEIYFQDFSVTLCRNDGDFGRNVGEYRLSKTQSKGRLKICSKSFVFDPTDVAIPMIKFPLRYLVDVEESQDAWSANSPAVLLADALGRLHQRLLSRGYNQKY